jgi:lipid A 3-O-deacylase
MRLAFAAFLAAAGIGGAGADEAPRWYVQLDNDVVFYTDRWFSSGLRLSRVHQEGERDIEWGIVQEIYTPEPKHFELGDVDRTPTARLLLVHARHSFDRDRFETLEFGAGVRGPAALGRQTTEAIHRLIAAREVDWSREGSNRFDGYVAWARSDTGAPIAAHYGFVAGTQQAFAHGALEVRFGNGARDVAAQVLRFAASPPFARSDDHGYSGFVGLGARVVARNALLDDGYDPFAPDPRRKRIVGRLAGGVAWTNHCAGVTFTVAFDTREFVSQRRPHGFGSLAVHFDF